MIVTSFVVQVKYRRNISITTDRDAEISSTIEQYLEEPETRKSDEVEQRQSIRQNISEQQICPFCFWVHPFDVKERSQHISIQITNQLQISLMF